MPLKPENRNEKKLFSNTGSSLNKTQECSRLGLTSCQFIVVYLFNIFISLYDAAFSRLTKRGGGECAV